MQIICTMCTCITIKIYIYICIYIYIYITHTPLVWIMYVPDIDCLICKYSFCNYCFPPEYFNIFSTPMTIESLFVNISICLFHVKASSRWMHKKLNGDIFSLLIIKETAGAVA